MHTRKPRLEYEYTHARSHTRRHTRTRTRTRTHTGRRRRAPPAGVQGHTETGRPLPSAGPGQRAVSRGDGARAPARLSAAANLPAPTGARFPRLPGLRPLGGPSPPGHPRFAAALWGAESACPHNLWRSRGCPALASRFGSVWGGFERGGGALAGWAAVLGQPSGSAVSGPARWRLCKVIGPGGSNIGSGSAWGAKITSIAGNRSAAGSLSFALRFGQALKHCILRL